MKDPATLFGVASAPSGAYNLIDKRHPEEYYFTLDINTPAVTCYNVCVIVV